MSSGKSYTTWCVGTWIKTRKKGCYLSATVAHIHSQNFAFLFSHCNRLEISNYFLLFYFLYIHANNNYKDTPY